MLGKLRKSANQACQTEAPAGRVCPACGNRVQGSGVLRCPRCNASLIKTGCDGNCKKCGMKSTG